MAADSAGSPRQPPGDMLPRDNNLLSSVISTNNSVYLYTPTELLSQRANLNASGNWFTVSKSNRPNDAYFSIEQDGSTDSSMDGWPSESYVELQKAKRLLVGFGNVDPQMRAYNFSGDESLVFPAGYLSSAARLTASATAAQSIGQYNNSWALSNIASTSTPAMLDEVGNITACGASPFLNQTLNNTDAGTNYVPYQNFVYAHVWSWSGAREPMYANSSSQDNGQEFSCAAVNATSGGWQAVNCNNAHHGACRVGTKPYDWRITGQEGIYRRIDAGCPDGSTFDVPRTALENTYLLNTWRDHLRSNDDPDSDDRLLWVNFNDLDTTACWVIGQNATCQYQPGSPVDKGRAIIVPTVAGIVVLVLAVLTIFTKCAANRQNSKRRRRRADDGFNYEGVPS
ncbi:Maintenance of telomere capping protein 6 [Recurvomyces mirabilis]|uniref:Maintenance of telomere capping protein 6 n=1 Tax=Recurvomyces mirabilis TaxID=574656 RepID=A0AAE0TN93_9PEZI|nr:Maintenance of telomere capping protein 6 [Recurvomyces mirabilis]KAK5156369.1 Maintenance of telomere capping protein 6 [Recurvomyces mirabilis]